VCAKIRTGWHSYHVGLNVSSVGGICCVALQYM